MPVTETTDWCSPAFFVTKADGIRVRLVTDYTRLNRHVKRPVHPFPSTKEITQAIPHGSKWFAKLDAVHGYFQLALDEESSFLTTFLLPQGKFRYLRAPMGLNTSSDEWCCHSDRIITGLPWCKIADALSRFPVFSPDISLDTELHEVLRCQRIFNASGMGAIHQAIDSDYKCMVEAVLSKQSKFPDRHNLKSIISRLSI